MHVRVGEGISMRTRIKNVGKALVDRVASRIVARLANITDSRTAPATKIEQLQLWHHYRSQIEAGRAPRLNETGFRCFSQFEEDGHNPLHHGHFGYPTRRLS